MNKKIIYIGLFVGSTIGGYVPTLFGVEAFSFLSLLGSTIGSIIGIYLMYKIIGY